MSYAFFAALRELVAVDVRKMGLERLLQKVIKEDVLPLLKKMMKAEKDSDKQETIGALMEEYEKWARPGSPEAEVFNVTAARQIESAVKAYRLDPNDAEDMAQQIVIGFLSPLEATKTGNTLRTYMVNHMEKLDEDTDQALVLNGPKELNRIWGIVVSGRVRSLLSQRFKKEPDTFNKAELMQEDDSGEQTSILDNMGSGTDQDPMSGQIFKEIKTQLWAYVDHHSKDELTKTMFKVWMEVMEKKGDHLNMTQDVFPLLTKKGFEQGRSVMNLRFMELKRMIVDFFQRELGIRIPDRMKKKLHLSSAQVLTFEEFRHRLASWVLAFA